MCAHINRGTSSQKHRDYQQRRATDWFQKHKVKAFYASVDGEDFESGSRSLMQASGIGKLRPNILMMGYKRDWKSVSGSVRVELDQYFDTIHKVIFYVYHIL